MSGWQRTLYLMVAAQLLSAAGFAMIFPFLPSYVAYLGSSLGLNLVFLVGAVFSGQALTMAIASPIWGVLSDRYGKKLMVERALFGGALIILLMGFASSAEMLVILRVIQGFITGTIAATNALVAATAPRERTGYAMGLLQVGLWSGIALGPLLGGVFADAFGYRVAFYLTSALLFLGGLLVLFGVERDKPEASSKRPIPGLLAGLREVLGSPGVGFILLLRFVGWLGRNVLLPYLPLFMASLVIDESKLNTLTGLVIALSSAAGTITAIYLGRLGDRVGHKRILIIGALAAMLFYLPQIWVSQVWELLILQALTGAAAGGIMPALSALLNHYIRPGTEGAAYGFENSVVSLSRALAPMLGAFLVLLGGYRAVFLVTALLFGLTAVLAYWKLPEYRVIQPKQVNKT
jgi:MFS transporter, DHA1 family, multidrug resistance protein